MQDEDNNLHTRLNPPPQDSSEPYHAHYPDISQQPPPHQQHQHHPIYPQYQPHVPSAYPSYNPQVAYPYPYTDQNRQGQYVLPVPGSSSHETLREITTRINTQFGCYMCLVYFEFVLSIISLVLSAISAGKAHEPTLIWLDVLLTLPLLLGCIVAIQAKSSLNKLKQYAAFVLFLIATVVSFVLSILVGAWTGWIPGSVIGLAIRSFIGLYLIMGSYSLYQLMRDRDNMIRMRVDNLFDPIIRS